MKLIEHSREIGIRIIQEANKKIEEHLGEEQYKHLNIHKDHLWDPNPRSFINHLYNRGIGCLISFSALIFVYANLCSGRRALPPLDMKLEDVPKLFTQSPYKHGEHFHNCMWCGDSVTHKNDDGSDGARVKGFECSQKGQCEEQHLISS